MQTVKRYYESTNSDLARGETGDTLDQHVIEEAGLAKWLKSGIVHSTQVTRWVPRVFKKPMEG